MIFHPTPTLYRRTQSKGLALDQAKVLALGLDRAMVIDLDRGLDLGRDKVLALDRDKVLASELVKVLDSDRAKESDLDRDKCPGSSRESPGKEYYRDRLARVLPIYHQDLFRRTRWLLQPLELPVSLATASVKFDSISPSPTSAMVGWPIGANSAATIRAFITSLSTASPRRIVNLSNHIQRLKTSIIDYQLNPFL